MKYREINKEVFYMDGPLVNVGRAEIDFLKERVSNTDKKRIRLCAHGSEGEKIQEMIILLDRETYIRPAKHIGKTESLHVIEGCADALLFDDEGEITQIISLGDYASGLELYYRLSEPVYHTLIIKSDLFIFHEVTRGPFRKTDTLLAPWAPEEGESEAVGKYVESLARMATDITAR